MTKEIIHNADTGEIIEKEYSPQMVEYLKQLADLEIADKKIKEEIEKNHWQAKSKILEKLGITEDEARLLLS
jgi:hypothetical protein